MTAEPLLIVGHGTVDERGVAEFTGFVARMRQRMAGIDVAGGFIELAAQRLRQRESSKAARQELQRPRSKSVAAGEPTPEGPKRLEKER